VRIAALEEDPLLLAFRCEAGHYMLPPREDWLPIAEQASKEMDPEKLMILVEQLCSALDYRKKPAEAVLPGE